MKNKYLYPLYRKIALVMVVLLINQICFPLVAYALTSGPNQPEFTTFSSSLGSSEMVDLYTGNFNYSLNLGDVDGLPIALSYSADAGMDDEASWVGSGWSLSYGAINRTMRGLPDDFNGEKQKREHNSRIDITQGKTIQAGIELLGFEATDYGLKLSPGVNTSLTLTHNNKYGFNATLSAGSSLGLNIGRTLGKSNSVFGGNISTSLSFSGSSNNGHSVTGGIGAGFTLQRKNEENKARHAQLRAGFDTQFGAEGNSVQTRIGVGSDRLDIGMGASSYFSNRFTYTPTFDIPIVNETKTRVDKLGVETMLIFPNASVGSFSSIQKVAQNSLSSKCFGYLYEKPKNWRILNGVDRFVSDYNSDGKGWYEENTSLIPSSFATNDLFSIAGPGTNGVFRAKRNDIGNYIKSPSENKSKGTNLGGDLGFGQLFHFGLNVTLSSVSSKVSDWSAFTNFNIPFYNFHTEEDDFRRFQFQMSGENKVFQSDIYDNLGGTKAVSINLVKEKEYVVADGKLNDEKGNIVSATPGHYRDNSYEALNTNISYLTVGEAEIVGLENSIESYPENTLVYGSCNANLIDNLPRNSLSPLPDETENISIGENQISQFATINNTGFRSIYGIPVYNKQKNEVRFSIDQTNIIENETSVQGANEFGLVKYTPDLENSFSNDKNLDRMFDKVTMPAYASSYLLTGFVSPDYIDRTGDGISSDDHGNAYKFNYFKHLENYQWRFPFQENRAFFHDGLTARTSDDQASYTHGVKNLWYMHSVESKNRIAQFIVSERNDGQGVKDENGGIHEISKMMKLDTIKIFSKAELASGKLTPLKSIIFSYSNEIYPGIPNNSISGEGKLTLKKVHFLYEGSKRGVLNAYKFDYQQGDGFKQNMKNRWGRYQKNPSDFANVKDYPFALQSNISNFLETHAGDWNLNKVTLPTGAIIDISYEADDYAYVQNKRAGQMMEIIGFKEDDSNQTIITDNLYNDAGEMHQFVAVKLSGTVEDLEEAVDLYLANDTRLYYDVSLNLDDNNGTAERCKGWLGVDPNQSAFLNDTKDVLFIPVLFTEIKNSLFHPIVVSGLQLLRSYFPEEIYTGMNASDPGDAIAGATVSLFKGIIEKLISFEKISVRKNFCRSVNTNNGNSWIRLFSPTLKKIGGDSRVKNIRITDNWQGDGLVHIYGTDYSYTTTTEIGGKVYEISSGVASYEPEHGTEENMLIEPIDFEIEKRQRPTNFYFAHKPVGDFLYPSASVGYRKVVSKPFLENEITVERTKDGFQEVEFYTSKDFPTKSTLAKAKTEKAKNPLLEAIFKGYRTEEMGISQGISVILNDMAGKMKSTTTKNALGIIVGAVKYNYKVNNSNESLSSEVEIMNRKGEISNAEIGKEFEMWHQSFQETTKSDVSNFGAGFDLIGFPPPFIFPHFVLRFTETRQGLKVMTSTKVIHQKGLIESIEVFKDGAMTSTENLVYDAKLGTPIITKTMNEFQDPIYSFTQPAYWKYEGMAFAGENVGEIVKGISATNGKVNIADTEDKIFPGDEVLVSQNGDLSNDRNYIYKGFDEFHLLNRDGSISAFNGPIDVKVIRSGRRNLLSSNMQSITSKKYPVTNGKLSLSADKEIINSSAVTYRNNWPFRCPILEIDRLAYSNTLDAINPYVVGNLGNWRVSRTHAPNYQRNTLSLVRPSVISHVQHKGAYSNFVPFFEYDILEDDWNCTGANFIAGNENRMYDEGGNLIEEMDALGIFSSAYFGFNFSLPIIVASNAKYDEKHFDGFEEYSYLPDCNYQAIRKHLTFFKNGTGSSAVNVPIDLSNLTNEYAHSGKHSLQIQPGEVFIAEFNFNDDCLAGPARNSNVINSLVGKNADSSRSQDRNSQLSRAVLQSDNCPVYESCMVLREDGTVGIGFCNCCIPHFNPQPGRTYWLSAWIATASSLNNGGEVSNTSVSISENGTVSNTYSFSPEGPIIDGWQRIGAEVTFDIGANLGSITLSNSNMNNVYLDDLRIHPMISNVNTYVYDPYSQRLMAALDENNYATFYEYDDEGLLIRVKRETEIGVTTLQEGRIVAKPNNIQ